MTEPPSEKREEAPNPPPLSHGPLSTEAFPDLFRTHAPFAWRCLRRLGVAASDADDVCQEVFMIVYRKLGEYDGRASLRAWIYGICVKKASDHRRLARNKREQIGAELPEPPHPGAGPEAHADSRRALAKLDLVLDDLNDDQRAAFVLYEVEGLSLQEVAESCGAPLQTIYSRLQTARRAVEAALATTREELR